MLTKDVSLVSPKKKSTYIDLFAGCGGLSLGLHNSGVWEGLFAIEKSPDAFKTLKYNLITRKSHFQWPEWLEKKNHDINDIIRNYSRELRSLRGTVDMVAGGPPCQGFSTAGRRIENDSRNDLINSYVRFIELVRPRVIFFENVKGFTQGFKRNKSKGLAYSKYVVSKLESLGYSVKGDLIDFSEYGIPQKRTRFILVGIKEDESFNYSQINNESFFERLEENKVEFLINKKLIINPTLEDAISDLLRRHGTVASKTPNFQEGVYGEVRSLYQKHLRKHKKSKKTDSHRFANHTDRIETRFQIAIEEGLNSQEYRARFNLRKSSTRVLDGADATPTITTLPDDYIHYCEPRIMTVREYARIQSFPDTYIFKGKYTTGGKLRTKEVPRYSQIGNAIPPLFGEQSGLVLNDILNEL